MASDEVIVIGAGPNGLSAAITLVRAGLPVTIYEAQPTVGGAARSAELTLPGFMHDVCSAVHPLGAGSPFFRTLPLADFGLEWVHPPAPVAHPLDDGSAVVLQRSLEDTVRQFETDRKAYTKIMRSGSEGWELLTRAAVRSLQLPRHPMALAKLVVDALRPAVSFASRRFQDARTRALFGGMAAHSMLPLDRVGTSAFGIALAVTGHVVGWPFPRGGAQKISDALAAYARSLGVKIHCNTPITSLRELSSARAVLCDITPRQLLRLGNGLLPSSFCRKLEKYRYGEAAFKLDWALDGPIPWKSEACCRAGTLHLGGSLEEIAVSEKQAWNGKPSERPFVLVAQQSVFDHTRAPAGKHTAWAYCHVPNGFTGDMTQAIETQLERFAPGFRERILARSVLTPAHLEEHDANLVGGDISGGSADIGQIVFRPNWRLYTTPLPWLYLCSSSTPPGPGVHGLCGYLAAKLCLHRMRLPK